MKVRPERWYHHCFDCLVFLNILLNMIIYLQTRDATYVVQGKPVNDTRVSKFHYKTLRIHWLHEEYCY